MNVDNKQRKDNDMRNNNEKQNAVRQFRAEHGRQYKAIENYVRNNLSKLQSNANGRLGVSVADQVQMNTNCPYVVAEEIVNSEVLHRQILGF